MWLPAWLPSPNRISSSGHGCPDRFKLDQPSRPVLPGWWCTAVNCNPNCNACSVRGADWSGQPRGKNHPRYLRIVDDRPHVGGDLQDRRIHLIRTRPDDGKAGPATRRWLPVRRNRPWTAGVVLQRRPPPLYLIHEPGISGPERRERIVCAGDPPLFFGVQQLADVRDGPGTRRRECSKVEAHAPIISPSFLTGVSSPSLEDRFLLTVTCAVHQTRWPAARLFSGVSLRICPCFLLLAHRWPVTG